eukprot:SAG22_NODE_7067_length_780_cov_0.892805_1_plen_202_part_01
MRPRGGVRRLLVAAARAVWSRLLLAPFAAPARMLASLPLHCSCRSRRSRWPCRLSEPAMVIVERPEAVPYAYSPSFCRADCRGAGGRRDSSGVKNRARGANGRLSRCRSPGRQVRRAGGLPGVHRSQAASFLPSLVAGALLVAELKETLLLLGCCRQAENDGECGCAAVSGRQEGQPGHPSRVSAAFGWPSGRPNRLCRRRR